ncbi:hypothetical protein J6590_000004 [Homalodisca vitripennis]|nr:hypothetical protein J6590_000004 [Homalodisca vitripennis]
MYHVKALLQLGVGPFVLAQVRYRLESFHQNSWLVRRNAPNPDSPDNEEDEHNVTDDTLMNDNTPSVATTTVNNETQAFTFEKERVGKITYNS